MGPPNVCMFVHPLTFICMLHNTYTDRFGPDDFYDWCLFNSNYNVQENNSKIQCKRRNTNEK